jgi:hypothetical protein
MGESKRSRTSVTFSYDRPDDLETSHCFVVRGPDRVQQCTRCITQRHPDGKLFRLTGSGSWNEERPECLGVPKERRPRPRPVVSLALTTLLSAIGHDPMVPLPVPRKHR